MACCARQPLFSRRSFPAWRAQSWCAIRALEPLRESAHRTVVCVHLAEGNVAEALRAYENFRTLLAHELGVRPSDHMRRLVAQYAGSPRAAVTQR